MAPAAETSGQNPLGSANMSTTCVIGGTYLGPPSTFNHIGGYGDGMPYIGIAGDDPNDVILAACCLPYKVHFEPPCVLWCPQVSRDDNDDSGMERVSWTNCMRAQGLHPIAEFGGRAQPKPGWRETGSYLPAVMYSLVAVAVGLAIAFAFVQRVKVLDGRKMAAAVMLWKIPLAPLSPISEGDGERRE
ncbi:hypothetical protein MN608_05516 [Microdochium nivale]|nr:hypothetical protein MN608_05516 [Microdochium nivale]